MPLKPETILETRILRASVLKAVALSFTDGHAKTVPSGAGKSEWGPAGFGTDLTLKSLM